MTTRKGCHVCCPGLRKGGRVFCCLSGAKDFLRFILQPKAVRVLVLDMDSKSTIIVGYMALFVKKGRPHNSFRKNKEAAEKLLAKHGNGYLRVYFSDGRTENQ